MSLSISTRSAFRSGMRDGVPIGLGYFAVSFSLGIAANNAGMTPVQSFIASMLCMASAGEYAGFTLIAAQAAYLEVAVMTFVANARYMLMSCALSQRCAPGLPARHRLGVAYTITDEIFAISVARPGYLEPAYHYGALAVSCPCWSLGTMLGCLAGSLMPVRLVSAFSVALFGMFLAVIIPPCRTNKVIAGLIAFCFAASYGAGHLPGLSALSGGTRTILLTVLISAAAALLFPRPVEEEEAQA